ncbi:lysine-rich nucleolar protein 1 isoform X2 [Chiroxiphia lanceolata]|uniref:lysine-rich nucleolar protein 1 isoform X2 n=1 Tax=Chiroxiphia lanceolata TaxID=296741 RepID=UPI0013CE920A|nr:lysine-rich nucleolar protein 1 isoform X2 [Chiroxiphia lanceolata]
MIIKKKRKELHEEPIQKKKNVKTVIKIEEDDRLETKTKIRKKVHFKDECLDQSQPKNKKKKNKKKKVGSKLLKEAQSESFVIVKGHLDSELQKESEEQIKILKKKKKKVPCHSSLEEDNGSSGMGLSNCLRDDIKKTEFSFKKTKKDTALNLELDGEVTKKKKKKGSSSFSLEDIQDSEQKQSERVCKKPHKCISQEVAFTGENHDTHNVQNDGESCVTKKKRKKKDKSDSFLLLVDNKGNISGVPGRPIALSDFRKRKKQNSWEITLTNREEEDTGSIKETKKNKNRSKCVSSSTCEDQLDCNHSIPDKYLPAQQEVDCEEEKLSGKKNRKNFKGSNEVTKKKKKKKIHKEEEETTYSKVALNNDSASKNQKIRLPERNKKNKGSEMERAERVAGNAVDGALCSSDHMLCDRKGKKRKKVPPQDLAEQPGSETDTKKTKIITEDAGNESLEHLDGVIIVQEKKGNCDEVNIDKVRRQALQEEIDRESGKTKVFSSKVGQDTKFGQWSTAAFKSSEEEMKFFRLMGGFKKGSGPIQNLSATTNKPNMALNREGQEKLQQALKMEFDKAMDLKQHRGIGLGFQPTANKKGYIDKYTSRSIKFED